MGSSYIGRDLMRSSSSSSWTDVLDSQQLIRHEESEDFSESPEAPRITAVKVRRPAPYAYREDERVRGDDVSNYNQLK